MIMVFTLIYDAQEALVLKFTNKYHVALREVKRFTYSELFK